MSALPEFIGTVHIILGPYRGNPIGLYLLQDGEQCRIAPNVYPWNRIIGMGETTNKAAADFEAKWKEGGLNDEMYTGPHWEGGVKPEKPKPPPKPAAPPKSPSTTEPTTAPVVAESPPSHDSTVKTQEAPLSVPTTEPSSPSAQDGTSDSAPPSSTTT